jgi:flagellar basal-body rod protein FlgB
MNLFDKALSLHPYSLQLRLDRAQIIAGNLANVDTPGFLARDVDYSDILDRVGSNIKNKEARPYRSDEIAHELMYRIPYQAAADGNTSELNIEQTKFAANTMDFQTSLTFLNMKFSGLHKAIKGE